MTWQIKFVIVWCREFNGIAELYGVREILLKFNLKLNSERQRPAGAFYFEFLKAKGFGNVISVSLFILHPSVVGYSRSTVVDNRSIVP